MSVFRTNKSKIYFTLKRGNAIYSEISLRSFQWIKKVEAWNYNRTGITCKNTSWYMHGSDCRMRIVKKTKIYNYIYFWILPDVTNCRILISWHKWDFMTNSVIFLNQGNNAKLVPASFIVFYTFSKNKNKV